MTHPLDRLSLRLCRRSLLRRGPDLREELEQFGFGFLQLGAVEGEEIIDAEERLGHLGEEFLVVGQAVMLHSLAVVKQRRVAVSALRELFVSRFDARFVEAQLLPSLEYGDSSIQNKWQRSS